MSRALPFRVRDRDRDRDRDGVGGRSRRLGAALALTTLIGLVSLTGCASLGGGAAEVETRTFRFERPADLDGWIAYGGDWSVQDGVAVGRSLYPQSQRYSWLTNRTAWADVERVVVHAGLDRSSPHNLRIGVGAVTVILNWELADTNLVHYIGSDGHRAGRRALTPGRESEIVVESRGEGALRQVRLVVDDRVLWEDEGPPLWGSVTVYPALGSTIRVREVEITGRPAPCVEVEGPSMPHY